MAVVPNTTPKAADANSYVDVDFADAYFAQRLNAAVWTAASGDDKARAVIMATRHLEEQVCWDVEMCGCRTTLQQALEFPRIAVLTRDGDYFYPSTDYPPFLKNACCEQALFELTTDRTVDPPLRGIASVTADTVRMQTDVYADKGKGAPDSQIQHVLADIVWTMVEPWASNTRRPGALSAVSLVRV